MDQTLRDRSRPDSRRFRSRLETSARALLLVGITVVLAAGTSAQAPAPASESTARTHAGAPATHPDYATRMKLVGVRGFAQVTPNLYRGEQPTAAGFRNLAAMGINIDVDLRLSRKGVESKQVTALGMRYVSLPWFCMLPNDVMFARFIQLVRDNPDKKIFVHCRTGDDRVGMEIAAYRMADQGWTAEQAKHEMTEYGANWFHRRICIGLGKYESEFPERYKTKPVFAQLRGRPAAAPATASAGDPGATSQAPPSAAPGSSSAAH